MPATLARSCQWAAPSWVDQSPRLKANPLRASAKRTLSTAKGSLLAHPSGARGAGTRDHEAPPSSVTSSAVQGRAVHREEPSSHPLVAETKVTLAARNPCGTLPLTLLGAPDACTCGAGGEETEPYPSTTKRAASSLVRTTNATKPSSDPGRMIHACGRFKAIIVGRRPHVVV